MSLSPDEVLAQSKAAYGQWAEQWREYAKVNGEKYKKDGNTQQDLLFIGAGKTLVCVANGSSLEDHMGTLKESQSNDAVDIICCDKVLGNLLDNGVKPQYVILADANISYKDWMEPWKDQTKDIILISSICANIEWTQNWEGPVFYYVNKDNIQSEKEFSEISGCKEFIPASSNVGNTVVVFSVQIFGYDEHLLIGYDYSWGDSDNYYAYQDSVKRHWMKHAHGVDCRGEIVNTSQNLIFSSRWLSDYYQGMSQQMGIKAFNCSGRGILNFPAANLKRKLKVAKTRELNDQEKNMIVEKRMKQIFISQQEGTAKLNEVLQTKQVVNVVVNYLDDMGVVNAA